jgi:hypothetical protein
MALSKIKDIKKSLKEEITFKKILNSKNSYKAILTIKNNDRNF